VFFYIKTRAAIHKSVGSAPFYFFIHWGFKPAHGNDREITIIGGGFDIVYVCTVDMLTYRVQYSELYLIDKILKCANIYIICVESTGTIYSISKVNRIVLFIMTMSKFI
jgi:hypothetical protein